MSIGQGTSDCGVLLEAGARTTMSPLRHPPRYRQSSPLTESLHTIAQRARCGQLLAVDQMTRADRLPVGKLAAEMKI